MNIEINRKEKIILNIENEFLWGQVDIYCQDVKKEVKPLALLSVQNRYLSQIVDYVTNKEGLFVYTEDIAEGWTSVYIYKYGFMKEVILQVPNNPQTAYEHWILGKAFGYSDNEIANFIGRQEEDN